MLVGSHKAKILKLADMLSNTYSLFVIADPLSKMYPEEIKLHILPNSGAKDKSIADGLKNSLMTFEALLKYLRSYSL
jgi:hypothetical protein